MAHATRVALAATAVLGAVYLVAVVVLDAVASDRFTGQVVDRLDEQLRDLVHPSAVAPGALARGGAARSADDDSGDLDPSPVLVWSAARAGAGVPAGGGLPALPKGSWNATGSTTAATVAGAPFLLEAARVDRRWAVVGMSTAAIGHLMDVLELAEAVVAPVLLATAFAAALAIGVRAIAPVEQARQRQLEFTADASHELRTPLTVIEAEVALGLGPRGDPSTFRELLLRVRAEGVRLRRIVEDLLWLARVDAAPPRPADEPVDLGSIVEVCAERFVPVAVERGATLEVAPQRGRCWVVAPPEWMDRLTGVLVDNACRFAGPDGHVRVGVETSGGRVTLCVEDSGPGIRQDHQEQLFDRFHRDVDDGAGHGLGLAIADAVVRATGGRWRVGVSELGGARFEVSWRGR
ncbi:MAG: HAMP domain-containing sensor histidine kinase [Actinomycetota bacterium]|nr:HAMP domain-containing sensor histidine kinase [Actinomycetota bacterium]